MDTTTVIYGLNLVVPARTDRLFVIHALTAGCVWLFYLRPTLDPNVLVSRFVVGGREITSGHVPSEVFEIHPKDGWWLVDQQVSGGGRIELGFRNENCDDTLVRVRGAIQSAAKLGEPVVLAENPIENGT